MLINSIEQLKAYIPTVMGSSLDRYSVFLESAEQYLLTELIGETLFDKLSTVAANPDAEPPIEANTPDPKLLRHCEQIVCLKGYLDAIPMLDLVETDTGFAVTSNPNLAPASQQRVAALVKGLEIRLSDSIELLLSFLETSIDHLGDWAGCKAYTLNHDSFIFTLTEFRRYARYEGSHLEWKKDLYKVTQAMMMIRNVISSELTDLILQQLKENSLSDVNQAIIEPLRHALAAFITGSDPMGMNMLSKARNILLASVDDYPEFKASKIYTDWLAQLPVDVNTQSIANFGV